MRTFMLVGLLAAVLWEIAQLVMSAGNGILFVVGCFTLVVTLTTLACHVMEVPLSTELGIAATFTVPLGFLAVAALSDYFSVGTTVLASADLRDPRPGLPGTRADYERAFLQHFITLPLPFVVAGILAAGAAVRRRWG